MSNNVVGKLVVNGKLIICGEVTNENGLTCSNIQLVDLATYEMYKQGVFKLTFDANGGNVSETTKTGFYGQTIRMLPIPTRDYYKFEGWYLSNGESVTSTTVMNAVGDVTLYAHWVLNKVYGWVLTSSVPAGAQVVNTKYTYTQTQKTESTSSSLSGWTQVGKYDQYLETTYHNFADFPSGYSTSDTYYQQYSKSAAVATTGSKWSKVSNSTEYKYILWHWSYPPLLTQAVK